MPAKGVHRRKRRTRGHVIADLSVNHVERHLLRAGYTAEVVRGDYGIDMLVFFYNRRGLLLDGQVLIQLKATDRPSTVDRGRAVALRIDRRDLDFWLSSDRPVILALYDANADVAYWLYVQAALRKSERARRASGGTVTVRIPRANVIDEAAARQFAAYNEAVARQVHGKVRHHG